MNPKVIFLDVDGTLVNYGNELPPSAVEAIRKAQANGHKVIIVTGRSKAEMYQEIRDLGYDGYIGGNGNYIEYEGEVLSHRTLSLEDTTQIVDWLDARQLEYYLEANSGLYGSQGFAERGAETIKAYGAYKGEADADSMTIAGVFPEMIFGLDPYRDDINKISFILNDYQDYLDAKEHFTDYEINTWGGQGEQALFGDAALGNINKQTAIEQLLQFMNIPRADTFAFGDANIDIPMLEYCQVGVAMGNGGDGIKAMADYVTAAVDDDGLYKAFEHFGLI